MSLSTQRKPEKIVTNYKRPSPDEPLWVVIDCGNNDVKAMIHGRFGEEIWFPHRVRKPTENDYKALEAKYKSRLAQFEGSAIFRLHYKEGSPIGFVVGKHAAQVGQGERKLGAEKYVKGHLDALLVAALLQLYPETHKDVKIVVLHPADISADSLRSLAQAIYGTHRVETPDGRGIHYKVTEVIPLEEPVAALQTFLLTVKGETYNDLPIKFTPGTELLVLDIGGGFTGFVPCIITETGKIEPNLSGSPVIEAGIEHVMTTLNAELKSAFSELTSIQTLPRNMLNEALMTGTITIAGEDEPRDCADAVRNAMQSLADPVLSQYTNTYKRGVGYSGVVVSGGGGGVSYNYVKEHVLNHKKVLPAETDPAQMRFGAIRGASKGLIDFLAQTEAKTSEG